MKVIPIEDTVLIQPLEQTAPLAENDEAKQWRITKIGTIVHAGRWIIPTNIDAQTRMLVKGDTVIYQSAGAVEVLEKQVLVHRKSLLAIVVE